MAHDCETSHRYWYSAHMPEIGVSAECGWCFGVDALAAARNAVRSIRERNPRAEYLLASDVHVTHCTACSCIPPDLRTY